MGEGLPVSEVCRKYDISVTSFDNWQKILFEGTAQLFDRKPNAANVRRPSRCMAPGGTYYRCAEARRLKSSAFGLQRASAAEPVALIVRTETSDTDRFLVDKPVSPR